MEEFHRTIRLLYTGHSQRARRFRYGLIVFDALTIVYFIATAALPATPVTTTLNTALGVLILLDISARLWISKHRRRELARIYTVADLIVVASLLVAPLFAENLAFLRVLRGLRLIHSYHLLRDLRRESLFFRRHEDAILAAVNLFVFIFVIHIFKEKRFWVYFFNLLSDWFLLLCFLQCFWSKTNVFLFIKICAFWTAFTFVSAGVESTT